MNARSLTIKPEKDPSQKEGKLHVFLPDHIDDRTLWNSFRSGDEQAFVIIFDRTVKSLHNYGIKIISDSEMVKDTIQELFIELWKNRENLGVTDSIKLYLFKSLRRKLFRLTSGKRNKLFVTMPVEYDCETSHSQEFNLVAEQSSAEKKQRVLRLLEKLTKRQREAVFLRYFEEMEPEKIASVMELSKQAVYNLIHKALGSLRKNLFIASNLLLLTYTFNLINR